MEHPDTFVTPRGVQWMTTPTGDRFPSFIAPYDLMSDTSLDDRETLVGAKSARSQSKPHVNGQTHGIGIDPTVILLDACRTYVCAPSVLRRQACELACASIRYQLQKATLAHNHARRRGLVQDCLLLQARITGLRDDLARVDPRPAFGGQATDEAPRRPSLFRRILTRVKYVWGQ